MSKNARLNWLIACAGVAGLAGAAAASEPVPVTETRTPVHSTSATTPDGIAVRLPAPRYVDDLAALELANKLGLNDYPNAGKLRGLPSCPPILTDGNNCHTADTSLAANFSGEAPGSYRTIDNVTPMAQNPTRICWIGRYADRAAPAVANESFMIRIYANGVDGLPDLSAPIFQRLFQQNGTPGNDLLELSCLDGQNCPGTTNPAAGGHYVYSAEVSTGFPMNAFGCYWIEITNVGSNSQGLNWGWVSSQNGTDLISLQAVDGQYTTFSRVANDRAICISGGVDPLAGNCVVPPPPPICDNSDANGIPYDGLTGFGMQASWTGSVGRAGVWTPFQRAENISFSSPQSITSICFGGFWLGFNDNGQAVGIQPPTEPNFRVAYFTNSPATGVPGDPIAMAEFGVGDPGVSFIWDGEEVCRIIHPPVDLPADACSWVSVGRPQIANGVGQPIVPIWHWFLTTSSSPIADRRFASRQVGTGAPAAWQPTTVANAGDTSISNLWFLLSGGPATALNCAAPPCNIPAGGNPEGEPDCGLGDDDTVNGGCNSEVPVFSTITCGETKRGTVAFNGSLRDTDWYQFTLNSTQTVTLTVNSEFAGVFGFAGDAVGPLPAPFDCNAVEFINPAAASGQCTPVTLTRTLEPGTWTIVVVPNFGDTISCAGTAGNEYTLTLTCEGPTFCNIPAGGTPENEANCGLPEDNTNGGCVSDPFVLGTIACGETKRGTAAYNGATRDTDWYQFTLAAPSTVTLTLTAEFSSVVGFVGTPDGPVPLSMLDCASEDLIVFGATLGGNCSPVTVSQALPAGTYIAFVAPDFDGDVVSCAGTNGNEYTLQIQCGGGTVDCNGNGIDDAVEIAANPALDCFNPSVVQNPHVIGGPDGQLDSCQCQGNFNRDGGVNSTDISAMLAGWLDAVNNGNTNADINCSGSTNSTDISAFLTIWLAQVQGTDPNDGCP
jgi:hypothetical protein